MSLIKKFNKLDKFTKISILVILTGIVLRIALASIYHVSGDACWQLSNSIFIAENQKLPLFEQFGRDEPFWAPPLFHLAAASIYGASSFLSTNLANFMIKMLSPILGSLTLVFFFLIARRLLDKKTAFYSVLFLAFIPLHIDYSVFSYVDGAVTFLAVLSVYFAVKNNIVSASITAGLAILTKYNGIFIVPVLLYIIYSNNNNKKQLWNYTILFMIISGALGSIWFIRNWIFLGNPVWPFLNDIFIGFEVKSFAESGVGSINFLNLFSLNALVSIYLGIFGVPDGNINTLFFFQIPYLKIFLALWLAGTIIFSIPILVGLVSKKLKHKNLLYIWLGSFIILILLYVLNASWSVARFLLPALPALAIIWAHGFVKIENKFIKLKKIISTVLILLIIGFALSLFLKIGFAANAWNFYNDDFEWVKSNTDKNSIFLSGSQCIPYNIQRQTASPEIENIGKANHVFVNQQFKLDNRALFSEELLEQIKSKGEIVYNNDKTKTEVYRIK
jgi:4-amino-4-deoxy-L-arabinose transferase-like glycosyltransferase